ncbi:MAG TPA: 2-oxo acid dehydrogenase subunit E2 [Pirellulaceae bacterium]|nr:2-oxo acid dehydrogenase subunit E2 [Pirellulaceae bacterium]
MTIEIKLPALGEGVEDAEVLDVLVAEGDEVAPEQGIIEVETDKASAEIPCPQGGKVEKVHVSVGDTIHAGDLLLTLAEANGEESDEKASAKDEQSSKKKSDAADDETPSDGPDEQADEDQSKAQDTTEHETSNSDEEDDDDDEKEKEVEASPGQEKKAAEQKPAADTSADSSENAKSEEASDAADEPHKPEPSQDPVAASPAVRRYAREVDVDLEEVTGTGRGGRITREDVKAEVAAHQTTGLPSTKAGDHETRNIGEPESDAFGEVRVERLSKLQQTMARRMLESWTTIPRVTNFDDADVTELEMLRQASKADYAEADVKLTILPLIAKAVALTLKHHPLLNAVFDGNQGEIRFKQYVNLGIAIDTERGLVVPSLRQADLLSVAEIARRIERLSEAARENKLTRDDFYGSTFTISNLGSIGGTYSTPIVNPPELAILLLGRARRMRVFVDDEREEPRLMLPLSLSYDHRLIDGATAARFLNELKSFIEAPTRLLMGP